jgi:hypothetical protein
MSSQPCHACNVSYATLPYIRTHYSERRPSTAGAKVWAQYTDDATGNVYFADAATGETRWTCPPELSDLISALHLAQGDVSSHIPQQSNTLNTGESEDDSNVQASDTSPAEIVREESPKTCETRLPAVMTSAPSDNAHESTSASRQTLEESRSDSVSEAHNRIDVSGDSASGSVYEESEMGTNTNAGARSNTSAPAVSPRRRLSSLWSVGTAGSGSNAATSPKHQQRPVSKREGPAPVVEGYINKQGGGTRLFGRQNWKRR